MIGRTNKTLKMRVLLVDDDLGNPGSMRGRVLNELVEEFAERNAELIKAISWRMKPAPRQRVIACRVCANNCASSPAG